MVSSHAKPAFISVFTLMVIIALMTLLAYLNEKSNVFTSFCNMTITKAQAQYLARSGVEIGLSILNPPLEEQEQAEEPKEGKQGYPQQNQDPQMPLIARLLPIINRWMSYTLTEQKDGIDGNIQICICCEQGKINLNKLYDFQEHAFESLDETSWKDMLALLLKKTGGVRDSKKAVEALGEFLKKRSASLEDPSELLLIEEFAHFRDKQFYQLPLANQKKNTPNPIYLFDLFTTFSDTDKINPLCFSDGVCAAIGADRPAPGQIDKRKKSMQEWLKEFSGTPKWETQWDKALKKEYGIEYGALPKGFAESFCQTCIVDVFSIHAYATYNDVVQQVVAIVKRTVQEDDQEGPIVQLRILKMYWL